MSSMFDYQAILNNALDFIQTARVELIMFGAVVLGGAALYLSLSPIPFIPHWVWKAALPFVIGPSCYFIYMSVCNREDVDPFYRGDPLVRLKLIGITLSGSSVLAWMLCVSWIRNRTRCSETEFWQKDSCKDKHK
jgi:hypothetical protein